MANWIAGAIKHPGALHKELGIPQGQKIPRGTLAHAAGEGGQVGRRARFAEELEGFHHGGAGAGHHDPPPDIRPPHLAPAHLGAGNAADVAGQRVPNIHPMAPTHPDMGGQRVSGLHPAVPLHVSGLHPMLHQLALHHALVNGLGHALAPHPAMQVGRPMDLMNRRMPGAVSPNAAMMRRTGPGD